MSIPSWAPVIDHWLASNPGASPQQIQSVIQSNNSAGAYNATTGTFSLNGETYTPRSTNTLPSWSPVIDNWLASNPGAAPQQIQSVIQSNNPAGAYDATTGTFSLNGETYTPRSALTDHEHATRVGYYDDVINGWKNDYAGSIEQIGRQTSANPNHPTNPANVWKNPTAGDLRFLDDALGRMTELGMSPDEILGIAHAYGVNPGNLSQMTPSMNLQGNSIWSNPQTQAFTTGDQWVRYLDARAPYTPTFSLDWLEAPYREVAGQGDLYAGLMGRGYDDQFTRYIMGASGGSPTILSNQDLAALTSPYFNAADPFNVFAQNQDPDRIRQQLIDSLGTDRQSTLDLVSEFLYGKRVPGNTLVAPPITPPPVRPPPVRPPPGTLPPGTLPPFGGSDGSDGSGWPTSPWTDGPQHPIDNFGTDWNASMSGANWRDTVTDGLGLVGRSAYDFIRTNSTGNATLSSLQRRLKLNPGEIMAVYEEAIEYARANNLQIPLMPSVTTADAPFYNYGFNPGQKLFNREINGENVVNPIAAYLKQIYALRESAEPAEPDDESTPMAEGGRVSGGLNKINADPVIHRYMKGGRGGQDDDIPARLSAGEYVFDADAVAALGDGNSEAGAAKLDQMRINLRKHKRAAPANKIPPKAKSPEQYLKGK